MNKAIYGVELAGRHGRNIIYFTSLSERMTFLNMVNFGEFHGRITLIEKPKTKQGEKNNDK